MALSADRIMTWERDGKTYSYPQKGSTTIYAGALVFLDASGYAEPATAAVGKIAVGIATEQSVNAGSSGDVDVEVRKGVFKFEPKSGDEPLQTDVGSRAYAYDDETVALTQGSQSFAGVITAVESDGSVWIDIGNINPASLGRKYTLTLSQIDLDDEAALRTFYIPAPIAGTISAIYTTTYGASTAGADTTLTFSINSTAITGGVVTISSGSAAASIDSASPSAANVVALTDYIKLVITGAQTADSYANIAIVIDY